MIISTEAIVLKNFDYRETSRIVRFFTKEKGKVSGVLKGIRKDPKKFGSSADRFTLNDIVYYEYGRSDLHLVSQCDLKDYFFPLREQYKKTVAVHYALELVDSIMQTEEQNLQIYQLILDYFKALIDAKDIDKMVHIFQVKILQLSGFSPHLDSCVCCHSQLKGKIRFSLSSGGLVCSTCPTTERSFTVISPGTIASILHIERKEWMHSLRLGMTSQIKKELKFILNNFLVYHLEKKIRTAKFLPV